MTREQLRAAIDVRVARLVERAAAESWPIRADHCFLRIAYDNAVGAKWDTVVKPPAWRNLPQNGLADALNLLEAMHDLPKLYGLNETSLALRRQVRGR